MSAADAKALEREVHKSVSFLKGTPFVSQAFNTLRTKLPPHLCYHNIGHTEDVLHEVVLFAHYDGLPARQIELLGVAAAYHDIGFTQGSENHEQRGAKTVRDVLKKQRAYSPEEVDEIAGMILDTKLVRTYSGVKQVANTELGKYLLDADLSNLGRGDFMEKLETVGKELNINIRDFLPTSLQLIVDHEWHTKAAHALRQAKKEENIKHLKKLMQSG